MQKLKKRKIRVNPRLSFSDDLENGCEEEDGDNSKCNYILSESSSHYTSYCSFYCLYNTDFYCIQKYMKLSFVAYFCLEV